MDLNLIKKLVKIVDTSEITELEVEENGLKVKIAKKNNVIQPQLVSQPIQGNPKPAEEPPVIEEKPAEEKLTNLHEIRSPIVGTFYRAPAPDAEAYVQVGDMVTPGTVLCIVEAMKLLNEIESDVAGKIVKILVENGKPVEYNQPLFLIQTS
ncbi:MAG: acetyl-CoA carboxylase biotin carboxyl carrier protein [Ignavibacteriaceae bacterium]